jgi:hypothetical protein
MVTIKLLKKLKACKGGVEYFKREHGKSATLDEVLNNSNLKLNRSYAPWLGQNLPAEYLTWDERLALQFNDYDCAYLGQLCPAGVEGATWKARLALQIDDSQRAALAYHCPVEVEGSTWEARLRLRFNDSDRAWFGRSCPDGVEGATLEARLAVQLDDWGRKYVRINFGGEQ